MQGFRPLIVFIHIAIPLALVVFLRSERLETVFAERSVMAMENVGKDANWQDQARLEVLSGAHKLMTWVHHARQGLVVGIIGNRGLQQVITEVVVEAEQASAVPEQVVQPPSFPVEDHPRVVATPAPPPEPPYRFLIIGDSMITSSLGVSLEKGLSSLEDVYTRRKGVISTGLSRPDYYDWNTNLGRMIKAYQPNVAVIMMGTNDGASLFDPVKRRFYASSSKKYKTLYFERTVQLLRTLRENEVFVFWAGMPITENSKLNKKLSQINALQSEAVHTFDNARFIDTWEVFRSESKRVQRFLTLANGRNYRLRQTDGIHFTPTGGRSMAAYIQGEIEAMLPQLSSDTLASEGEEKEGENAAKIPKPMAKSSEGTEHRFFSEARGVEVPFHVFQPALAKGEKLPVVYLLHGVTGSYKDWKGKAAKSIIGLAQSTRQIIVTPDGGTHGWYLDSPLVEKSAMEQYLVEELVPYVDANFPTNGKRGITGLSMGGHGALSLHLKHPKVFLAASSMSGILDLEAHPEQWKLKDLLGPMQTNPQAWQAHSALRLLEGVEGTQNPLLVTVGNRDRWALKDNRRFSKLLAERGLYHDYRESPGGHSWRYWRQQLPLHLKWLAFNMAFPPEGEPVDDLRDFDGRTMLIRAARLGLNTQVRRLLDRGAEVNAEDSDGWTALMNAAHQGNIALVRMLIDSGATIDVEDKEKRTPLMAAAWKNRELTATLLLEKGADINRQDRKRETALIKAAKYNRRQMVSLLLEKGADINLRDSNRDTPLLKGARSGGVSVLRALHEKGADLEEANRKGERVLMIFAARNYLPALNYLLENGARTDEVDRKGRTALMLAAEQGRRKAVTRLLEAGADMEILDNRKQSALHYALLYGQRHTARLLVEAGATLTKPDADGASPLIGAVLLGDEKLVGAMLSQGADPNFRNREGKTALELAQERQRQSVIRALTGEPEKEAIPPSPS